MGIVPVRDGAAWGIKLASQPNEKSRTSTVTEPASQPEPDQTSTRLYSGQQCITSYFKSTKRLENGLKNGLKNAKIR